MTKFAYEIGIYYSQWQGEKRGNKQAREAAKKCGEAAGVALKAIKQFDVNFKKWCKAMDASSEKSKRY